MTRYAELMNERQAAGLCRHCGKPQAAGCKLCAVHRDIERARRRAKYAARKAAGKCIEHGRAGKASGGHLRCRACHAKYTAYAREWQRVHRGRGPSPG